MYESIFEDLRSVEFPIEKNETFKVSYFGNYYPKRYPESQSDIDTLRVIDLKNGMRIGVDHFKSKFTSYIDSTLLRLFEMIAMPSHSAGNADEAGGLRQLIKSLGATDLSHCLYRHTEVPKSSTASTRPTAEQHRDSMKPRYENQIQGKDILLIDDVITKGSSMRAARYWLRQAKVRSVYHLAMTHTFSGQSQRVLRTRVPTDTDILF